MKRNAFLEQYKRESLGDDTVEEFESARGVLQNLVDEYIACESPDYLDRDDQIENVREPTSASVFDVSSRLEYS